MKICSKCNKEKKYKAFNKDSSKKDGLHSSCKDCKKQINIDYHHSKSGLVSIIYLGQISRSKKKGFNNPTYTKKELRDWLYSQSLFHKLFDNWKRLDFQTMYVPSVDRKDDYIGYTMDNIQLMTWQENADKSYNDVKNGINNKQNKKIGQYSKNGDFIKKYNSIRIAERETGIHNGSISDVCNGKKITAGNFIWRFL